MSTYGFVYVLSNPVMQDDVYKIGMTLRSPVARTIELSQGTGVPAHFDLLYYMEVENPAKVEAEIHRLLQSQRVNDCREFFWAERLNDLLSCLQDYAINETITQKGRAALSEETARTGHKPVLTLAGMTR